VVEGGRSWRGLTVLLWCCVPCWGVGLVVVAVVAVVVVVAVAVVAGAVRVSVQPPTCSMHCDEPKEDQVQVQVQVQEVQEVEEVEEVQAPWVTVGAVVDGCSCCHGVLTKCMYVLELLMSVASLNVGGSALHHVCWLRCLQKHPFPSKPLYHQKLSSQPITLSSETLFASSETLFQTQQQEQNVTPSERRLHFTHHHNNLFIDNLIHPCQSWCMVITAKVTISGPPPSKTLDNARRHECLFDHENGRGQGYYYYYFNQG
jgi:hypothetical protein